jgi:GAF domain-containing protein
MHHPFAAARNQSIGISGSIWGFSKIPHQRQHKPRKLDIQSTQRKPVAIYDAPNDPRVNYHDEIKEEGIKSILAVPIKNDQEIIGVLRLLTDSHRSFSASDIHFAVTVAEEGGNAIENDQALP